MFGHRSDGKVLKKIDPIVALTPYLMPMRCDAQVMLKCNVDYEKLMRYIVDKGNEGYRFTFMEILIAAFVRTVSEIPECNRFIVNKRLYARTQLTASFVVLKEATNMDEFEENTVKCHFDPKDTIYDVAERVNESIKENRKADADNSTMKVARLLLNPILANIVVGIVRFMDRYGIMPKYILDASPFHTSMFVTNMASIGMPAVNHHIYNFGTTSVFFSIGTVERVTSIGANGQPIRKRYLPIGIVADERICAGAIFSKFCNRALYFLNHPEELEHAPETVKYEENNEYHYPVTKAHRLKHGKD